jgi:hypothetical protein
MTLTVPRAGVVAGRAAEIRVPEPEIAGDIAAFGARMQQVGQALTREQQGRQLGRARIDMMSGLNDLRLELENSGDPDLIDSSFSPRANALRDRIVGNLPEAIRGDAALDFDDMTERNRFALGRVALGLRQSQHRVLLGDMQGQVVQSATGMDADSRAGFLDDFNAQIAEAVQAGVLDPEQGARLRDQTAAAMDRAEALRLQRDDPQALLAALEAGELFGQSEEDRQSWITRTRAAMETADRQRQAEVRDALREGTAIYRAGRVPQNSDVLIEAAREFEDMPEANSFGLALGLYEARPDFALLTPDDMRAALAQEQARGVGAKDELWIADAMRDALAEAEAAWAEDPIGHAEAIGLGAPPELPDPRTAADPSARMALSAGLRRRLHFAEALRDAGYVDDLTLFRPGERGQPGERDAFAEVADPMAPPPQRAALAWAFGDAFGEDARARATELGGDPVFAHVAGLVHFGGGERLARDIFEGQRALASGDVPLPAQNRLRQGFFVEFGALFDHEFEADARDPIIDAAMALYAHRARGDSAFSDGRISETLLNQTVHEVLGGTGTYDRRGAAGGVQTLNGHRVMVPAGVTNRDLSRAWRVVNSSHAQPDRRDALLREISVGGTVPSFGGEALDNATWQAARWVPVGHGRYALAYGQGDEETFAFDETGDLWQFDLWALLRRAGGE